MKIILIITLIIILMMMMMMMMMTMTVTIVHSCRTSKASEKLKTIIVKILLKHVRWKLSQQAREFLFIILSKNKSKQSHFLVYFVSNSEIQGKVSSLSDTNRLHDVACDPWMRYCRSSPFPLTPALWSQKTGRTGNHTQTQNEAWGSRWHSNSPSHSRRSALK